MDKSRETKRSLPIRGSTNPSTTEFTKDVSYSDTFTVCPAAPCQKRTIVKGSSPKGCLAWASASSRNSDIAARSSTEDHLAQTLASRKMITHHPLSDASLFKATKSRSPQEKESGNETFFVMGGAERRVTIVLDRPGRKSNLLASQGSLPGPIVKGYAVAAGKTSTYRRNRDQRVGMATRADGWIHLQRVEWRKGAQAMTRNSAETGRRRGKDAVRSGITVSFHRWHDRREKSAVRQRGGRWSDALEVI
ncbi:TonB box, conserved site [Penicillium camemberti]|uniref:TonB box, conserved site n=1 Tax=Penicillium camemberti (strain FM 013) TaxID=1429867 RepID=A0A0G4PWU4_PENC3|nr:TonB box, conserved site [Penicillium camemberti]